MASKTFDHTRSQTRVSFYWPTNDQNYTKTTSKTIDVRRNDKRIKYNLK